MQKTKKKMQGEGEGERVVRRMGEGERVVRKMWETFVYLLFFKKW